MQQPPPPQQQRRPALRDRDKDKGNGEGAPEFLSLDNVQHCEARFRRHMKAKHGIELAAAGPTVALLRRTLYQVMEDLARSRGLPGTPGALPLIDMNNLALNSTRDIMQRNGGLLQQGPAHVGERQLPQGGVAGSARKPQPASGIQRGRDVYGDRPPFYNTLLPENTNQDFGGHASSPGPGAYGSPGAYSPTPGPGGYGSLEAYAGGGPPPAYDASGRTREEAVLQAYEQVRRDRDGSPLAPPPPQAVQGVQVQAMGQDDFARRMAEMEQERSRERLARAPPPAASGAGPAPAPDPGPGPGPGPGVLDAGLEGFAPLDFGGEPGEQLRDTPDLLPPRPGMDDPTAAVRHALADQDAFRAAQQREHDEGFDQPWGSGTRAALLQPPPAASLVVQERYMAVNGFDRDYAAFPYRYRFDVSVGGAQAGLRDAYRDVVWVEATRLMLPMEILQPSSSTAALAPGTSPDASDLYIVQKHFLHDFSLSYPYVMLMLTGLDGAYDGTNEALRRGFAMFVYDRSYKAPNGRGYVLLRPAQRERRRFATPLASLRTLSLSIARPTGALVNNSTDSCTVVSAVYDPTPPLSLYLELVCGQYFEGNEFYVGDQVMVRGFSVVPPAGAPSISPYTSLAEYVNRPEGHEVVRLGTPNENQFYRSLFILAPGVLDQVAGRVVLDANILAALQGLVGYSPTTQGGSSTGGATPVVSAPGRLLNMSLQPVLAMKVGTLASEMPRAGMSSLRLDA